MSQNGGSMRIVAIDLAGHGPWHREEQVAADLGAEFVVLPYAQFCAGPPDCVALINGGAWPLPPELLDAMPSCRMMVSFGTGMDWIDLDDASARGIVVARTPHANVQDVATHALTLILACAHRLVEGDANVRLGEFDLVRYRPVHRLRGRRLGLLSFGNVPRHLCELVEPFGMEIRAYDPLVSADVMRDHNVESSEFNALLGWADILSVHTPETDATRGLLGEGEFRRMRQGATVVMTSRGGIYDADALARLLHEGHIGAAGLDVFPIEPLPTDHALLTAPHTVFSPHIAGYSEGALDDYHQASVEAVRAFFAGRTPEWVATA